MYKIQKELKSMNFEKNLEKYKFNPARYTISVSNQRMNKAKDFNKYYNNIRDNIFNKTSRFPPIYFYKKVSNPYKYNISSVPKYLIKTNEEKRFIEKLYNSLTNEKDKNILKDLLDKNKKKIHFKKDNYKPQYVDVQKLLIYRPNLYSLTSDPLEKNNNFLNKKSNTFEAMTENINNKNNMIVNTSQKEENLINCEKKINNEKNELTEEEQIKYKYKLSDIFNFRKELVFLNKSAEKHLFRNEKNNLINFNNTCPNVTYTNKNSNNKSENKFYTSSESKSDWIPHKINNKKMGTNSSVAYNILCPMYSSGINRFVTASELNKNNLYNESPAFRRVKSISEFIDLTRVAATNTLGCFDRKMKIPNFKFNNNIGTNQLDAYHINRDLIEKPL